MLLLISIFVVFVSIVWEHIFRINEFKIRPTFFLGYVASFCEYFFEWVGYFLGMLCSYPWFLRLQELKITLFDLGTILMDIFMSWTQIIVGWTNYVKSFLGENFMSESWQFYLGFLGIVLLICFIVWCHFTNMGKKYCPWRFFKGFFKKSN